MDVAHTSWQSMPKSRGILVPDESSLRGDQSSISRDWNYLTCPILGQDYKVRMRRDGLFP